MDYKTTTTKCGNFLLRFITEAKVDIRFHRKTQAIDDLCRRYLIDQIAVHTFKVNQLSLFFIQL
jgi:hypothetical protein